MLSNSWKLKASQKYYFVEVVKFFDVERDPLCIELGSFTPYSQRGSPWPARLTQAPTPCASSAPFTLHSTHHTNKHSLYLLTCSGVHCDLSLTCHKRVWPTRAENMLSAPRTDLGQRMGFTKPCGRHREVSPCPQFSQLTPNSILIESAWSEHK